MVTQWPQDGHSVSRCPRVCRSMVFSEGGLRCGVAGFLV